MPDGTNGHELHAMVLELTRGQNFAALTTLLPNGHPQTQVCGSMLTISVS